MQVAFISTRPFKCSGPPSRQVNCSRTHLHSPQFQRALIPLSSPLHFLYSCLHIFISNKQNPVTRCCFVSSIFSRAGKYQFPFSSRKPVACSSPFASHSLIIIKVSSASSIGLKSLFDHHLSTFLTIQFYIYIFRNRNYRT